MSTTTDARCIDFVIAGSAKSGTTALSVMLDQHPDVYMSDIKETEYFVHGFDSDPGLVNNNGKLTLAGRDPEHYIDTPEKFHAQFHPGSQTLLRGEASPRYLLEPDVPARLMAYRSDIKVLIILRDPASVAYANFIHQVRDCHECIAPDDWEAFLDESRYARPHLHPFAHHLALPAYARHLPAWIDTFTPEQLHIMIYEDFLADRRATLSKLFSFLGLRDDVEIDIDQRVNTSGLPRLGWVHSAVLGCVPVKRLLRPLVPTKLRRRMRLRIEELNTGVKPMLDAKTRACLDERYQPDVRYVESVLDRTMTSWCRSKDMSA